MMTIVGMRRLIPRGTDRVRWAFTFAAAAYNLIRLPKLEHFLLVWNRRVGFEEVS